MVAKLDKYGELLEEDICPECGNSIKSYWKACPECGTRLTQELAACPHCGSPLKPNWKACPECGTKIEKAKESAVPASDRFICPGCGEKSSAKNGFPCGNCKAFVHYECLVQGKETGDYALYYCRCPACEAVLGAATYDLISRELMHIDLVNPNKDNVINQNKHERDKFTCPGCGESSTAKTGKLCKTCNAFVHDECLLPGPTPDDGPSCEDISVTVHWQKGLCPTCKQHLCIGYFEYGKYIGS